MPVGVFKPNNFNEFLVGVRSEDNRIEFDSGLCLILDSGGKVNHIGDKD